MTGMRVRAAVMVLAAAMPSQALAWGSKGHRIIGELAARNFPATIPAFLRTPAAATEIGELAREPDRSRDAGQPHDNDNDPAHFVDGSDDGTVLGGPSLLNLPPSRQDYDTALRAVGSTEYKAGWLPYSLMDGWQQLVKDFVLWRADVAGAKFAKNSADKAWLTSDQHLRETITMVGASFPTRKFSPVPPSSTAGSKAPLWMRISIRRMSPPGSAPLPIVPVPSKPMLRSISARPRRRC